MPNPILAPLVIGMFRNLYHFSMYSKLDLWQSVNQNIQKTTKEHEEACRLMDKKTQWQKSEEHKQYIKIFKKACTCP